jgi:ArsR family transcriptional regulator
MTRANDLSATRSCLDAAPVRFSPGRLAKSPSSPVVTQLSQVYVIFHMSRILDITEAIRMAKSALAVVGHVGPAVNGEKMSSAHALAALAALGQPARLEIFRLLMRAGPDGAPAGALAEQIGCPHNTLSTNLAILARSGLVRGTREGRSIVYRADVDGIRNLVGFLVNDCCDGHPELCDLQDALQEGDCGCPPGGKAKRRKRSR